MILSATTDYLFDTTVFVDYLRNRNGVQQIMNERKTLISRDVYYSAITEFELWLGIQGQRTEAPHIELLSYFTPKLLTRTILRKAAYLHQPFLKRARGGENVPSPFDCMIAATAQLYALTIVTNNIRHFELLECSVLGYEQ